MTKFASLLFRTDTAAHLASVQQPFPVGEPIYALDTKMFKIGDGIHLWNDLKTFGSAAESYALTGNVIGDGSQTLIINVGTEDIKEINFSCEATGTTNVPTGSLMSGHANFKTGKYYLNYMGASAYYLGSWADTDTNQHLSFSKAKVGDYYYVTLKFIAASNPTYAQFVNGMSYRWYAIPLSAPDGGGGSSADTEHYAFGYKTLTGGSDFTVTGIVDQQGNAFVPKGYMFMLAPDVTSTTDYHFTDSSNNLICCMNETIGRKMFRVIAWTPTSVSTYTVRANPGYSSGSVGLGTFTQGGSNTVYKVSGQRYFWCCWG